MTGAGSPRQPVDLSLYLVVGPDAVRGRALHDVVLDAVAGGVTAVQLRWKEHSARTLVDAVRALRGALRARGVPVIVNDRVDVALAAEADGVHVGQDDLPVAAVRRLAGDRLVVGLSVTTVEEARAVDARLVDYAGVGPVFATATKPDAAHPLGVHGTREVVRALGVPAVAIGGIDEGNAARVLGTGVRGIAVVSAICGAYRPGAAAAALAATVREARGAHGATVARAPVA